MTDVIGTISSCVDLVLLIRDFVQNCLEADADLKDKLDAIQAKTAVLRFLKKQIEKYPSIQDIIIENFSRLEAKLTEAFEDVRKWANKFEIPLTAKFQNFIDKNGGKEKRLIKYRRNEAHAKRALTVITNISSFQRFLSFFIIGKHRVDYVYTGKLAIDKALSILKEIETNMHSLSMPVILATISRGEELLETEYSSQIHPCLPFISAARRRDKEAVSLASRTFDRRRIRTTDLEEFDICGGTGVWRLRVDLVKKLVPGSDSRATYILDMKRTPENSRKARAREEEAAKKFTRLFLEDRTEDDAFCKTTGLLQCLGYAESRRIDGSNELVSIEQILRLPKRISGFQTLRSILMEEWTESSIPETPDRLRLAVKLLESILVMHAMGLVHKAISPDTILVTYSDDVKIGTPYLFGFHQMRGEFQESGRFPCDPILRKSLYIHPNNTQEARHRPFEMLDDIYSFGVTLLEIVLWKSFFNYDKDSEKWIDDSTSALCCSEEIESPRDPALNGSKRRLLQKVVGVRKQSPKLANIIEHCLNCREICCANSTQISTDPSDAENPVEFYSEEASQAIGLAVRVIEGLKKLSANL